MSHPLDGCRTKMSRADEHLEELRDAIPRFFGAQPDLIPGEFDPAAQVYVFRAQHDVILPLEWSAIIGDVVHNLSAALDYLTCELVLANGGTVSNRTQFPIFESLDDYRARDGAAPKIKGMDPAAQAVIEQLQPFQGAPRDHHPSDHPLALLRALEIEDKHRALNLTTNSIRVRLHGLPADIHLPPDLIGHPIGPHRSGDVLARVDHRPHDPQWDLRLEVRHQVDFEVQGPGKGRDVLETLGLIRGHVRDRVIPTFLRFF